MHTNNHCKQCTTSNIHVPMSEHMEVTQYYLEFLEFWKIKHMRKQWIPDPFLLFFLTGLETRLHTLSSKSSYLTCFKHRALWLMQLDSGQPSFPGSCAWAKKKEPGLCMLSSLRISENLEISIKSAPLRQRLAGMDECVNSSCKRRAECLCRSLVIVQAEHGQ